MTKSTDPKQAMEQARELAFIKNREMARQIFDEAWEKAQLEGVDSSMLAGVMISEILDQLVEDAGEWAAVAVIRQLAGMEVDGNFRPLHSVQ